MCPCGVCQSIESQRSLPRWLECFVAALTPSKPEGVGRNSLLPLRPARVSQVSSERMRQHHDSAPSHDASGGHSQALWQVLACMNQKRYNLTHGFCRHGRQTWSMVEPVGDPSVCRPGADQLT